jgi:GH25 family lysozyme M1 (1,4-beta-N-acetylmuramidase)
MKRKLLAFVLTLAITASFCVPAFAEDATDGTDTTGGSFTLPFTGVDVSEHRGVIDWSAVKSSGAVQFAIIRDGFGKEDPVNQTDDQFVNNYTGAVANGIKVGVYHYSYATTAAEAVTEAQFCLSILNGRHLDMPVFYDVEDKSQSSLTSDQLTSIISAFCNTISRAGYLTGIYSSASWYSGKLNCGALANYNKWVANYGVGAPNYNGEFAIWQTTSSGTVAGISGSVDMDNCYKDYSEEKPIVVPALATAADNAITSDTSYALTLKAGKSYTFKFTPNGTKAVPSFTTGNTGVVKVVSQKKIGSSYYVKITASKKATTSVYSTFPKQKAVARCVVTVA